MSNGLVGLFIAIGAGGWIYLKLDRRSGGVHSAQAGLIAGIVGLLFFILTLVLLGKFFPTN